MASLWARLKRVNWDDTLAYSTVKTVTVRDYRLGLVHYFCLLLIALYIIVWSLLFNKRYLWREDVYGSFRLSLRRPQNGFTPAENLPYCLQNQTSYLGHQNYNCRYLPESLVVFPTTEENAMLVSTRITESVLSALDSNGQACNFTTPDCSFVNVTTPTTFYAADIEQFTLLIDHAIYATETGMQRNAIDMNGKLLGLDGSPFPLPDNGIEHVGVKGQYDVISIKNLLASAGCNSLDVDGLQDGKNESWRYSGTVILIVITYSNEVTFNTNYVEYTVRVRQVANTEFKTEQAIYLGGSSTKYDNWNRHGIRIIIAREGQMGVFDFHTFLVTVFAGSALSWLASWLVDLLAFNILPEKVIYREYKTQLTPAGEAHAVTQHLAVQKEINGIAAAGLAGATTTTSSPMVLQTIAPSEASEATAST